MNAVARLLMLVAFASATLLSSSARAHDQAMAVLRVVHEGERWGLAMDFGNAGALAENVAECRGASSVEQCLVDHIKHTVSLTVNGDQHPALGRGKIWLGSHVSRAIFAITGMPQKVDTADIQVRTFFDGQPYQSDLVIFKDGAFEAQKTLTAQNSVLHVGAAPEAPKERAASPSRLGSFGAFVGMGVTHVLSGWDHLLFIVALALGGGRLRSLLGAMTAFTVAHSVTLACAVLGLWTPSPRIVEPLIALSIAYVGFENLFAREARHRWCITLPFGLVHGFGFAGALIELNVPRAALLPALAGFNVGVELAQAAVLVAAVPLALWLRTSESLRGRPLRGLSAAIGVVGLLLAVVRVVSEA